ncbi:glycosyltransferase family 4 protein [Variovorax sp. PBL-E5]|uniref:glycosyltransferase family 4 protein n=1 Tax=Variovorax sp. PBL-E5 TaxID=434014 RepID=UPI0013160BD5|nr:glycosyltransferase family 4 protein [Variovorax sp. PBL-E5]VTU34037.1 2-deoxystreptamine glucosyltransferase [Variovorax sp. PBL-E5]
MGRLRRRLAGETVTALRCSFLVPGELGTRTGGYSYDRRIIEGLRALRWQVDVHSLGEGYPMPGTDAIAQTKRVVEALPDHSCVVVDGLAFGAMAEMAQRHAQRLRWIALVHHPLALETGLSAAQKRALFDSEKRALATARCVIVTSPSTARALAGFDVPASHIVVAEPGTDPAPLATGSGADDALSLLCVASVTPRKGHRLLVEALAGLKDRRWTLRCAGSLTMDAACAREVDAAIERHGLRGRVVLHGELDEAGLQPLYAGSDLFVLPSFHEGYGMALAEALARGIPVLGTTAGAIPDTVPADAGVLVAPGDAAALRAALQRLLDDPASRARLAEGAWTARLRLPTWAGSAMRVAAALGEQTRIGGR